MIGEIVTLGLLVLIFCTALLIGFMRFIFYLADLGHEAVSPIVQE